MIYLDHNATSRPCPQAIHAMRRACDAAWANPSSMHRAGQEARRELDIARQQVADLVRAKPREIVFTSGATESNNLAIRGVIDASRINKPVIITTTIEHESIRELCDQLERRGRAEIRRLPAATSGVIDTAALEPMLDERVAIVSVMWANNETGAIQPIEQIGAIIRQWGAKAGFTIPLHTDATQCVGRIPVDLASLPVDLASMSAHKFHAIKGAGALYTRRGVRLLPTQPGIHELARRGGTENVPGILAMGAAAQAASQWLADESNIPRLAAMRDNLERAILAACPWASINAREAPRLWNTTNIAFPHIEAEALLMKLSEKGVCASAGAACSSGSLDPSPVLLAMGIPEPAAHGSLRFSLGRDITQPELDQAAQIIASCASALRDSTSGVV